MKKFWNWIRNSDTGGGQEERVLRMDGVIAEDSWFGDEVTPQIFKEELNAGSGNITVWINSPGGDCFAAAQIYNMLRDYPGNVTVKVDSLAASAASVIAMAGDNVLISPVGMMMIHNPATMAWGDHIELTKTIEMLDEVKNSIINAYMVKTGMSRSKLSRLMDEESWMNAAKAIELGFADGMIEGKAAQATLPGDPDVDEDDEDDEDDNLNMAAAAGIPAPMIFSRACYTTNVTNKLKNYAEQNRKKEPDDSRNADELMSRLMEIKNHF